MSEPLEIVDAHLDLAYNALRGRDLLVPAAQQVARDWRPAVSLPELRAAGVVLMCATLFCEPIWSNGSGEGYRTAEEAEIAGRKQLAWYREMERRGEIEIKAEGGRSDEATKRRSDEGEEEESDEGGEAEGDRAIPTVLIMEGADPIRTPADLAWWFGGGVRIVGLAWKQTRYAGGTGAPGPLTADGVELVREMDRLEMIHDVSHLAEESFWGLLKLARGPVMASHSNCRALIPTDRHLSDEMIRALVGRGGVIGINLFEKFLVPPEEKGRRATLGDVVKQVRHVCEVAGDIRHVGIGSDMDGGFGGEQLPEGISTSANLRAIAEALRDGGFGEEEVRAVMGGNWRRFLGS